MTPLFYMDSLKIPGTADSYNLVPVDPHINAQGEHRGPESSGIEEKPWKTLTGIILRFFF